MCKLKSDFLYNGIRSLLHYLVNFYEVYLFFFLNLGFLAIFVQAMLISFPKYQDGDSWYTFNFSNYFKSFNSLFIYITENNSPQLLVTQYPNNICLSTLLFSLIYINNILLLSLIIGITYYKMKLMMADNIDRVCKNNVKKRVFEKLVDYPNAPKKYIKQLIALYIAGKMKNYFSMEQLIDSQYQKTLKANTASQYIFDMLKRMKSYELFYSIVDGIIAMFAMYVIYVKTFDRYQHFLYMILLCGISSMDFLHHCAFAYIENYRRTWKTVTSFALNIIIASLSVALLINETKTTLLIKIWGFMCIAKLFRFSVFYFRFDRKKLKKHILYPFMRQMGDLSRQMFVVIIIFSMIGLIMVGGSINDYTVDVYNKEMKVDYNYGNVNFNSFLNSLVSFYAITLNDSWATVANLAIVDKDHYRKQMRIIFMAFKVIVNFIIINSLIAFVIEIFHQYQKQAVYIDQDVDINISRPSRKHTYDELSELFSEAAYQDLDKTFK